MLTRVPCVTVLLAVACSATSCGGTKAAPADRYAPSRQPTPQFATAPTAPSQAPQTQHTWPERSQPPEQKRPDDPARFQQRAPLLRAHAISELDCGQLDQAYGASFSLALACTQDSDCSTLQETRLICPGCRAYVNPHTRAHADLQALDAAFAQRRCSLAPCTPPLCQHLSVRCHLGHCATQQR